MFEPHIPARRGSSITEAERKGDLSLGDVKTSIVSREDETINIPSSILLQMLGKSRVTKFVLQEILSITIQEFIKKENLKVNPEIRTTQTESEMETAFRPGSAFGFNVILQLEKSDSDEDSEEQSDSSE
nr:unnamed protein product [Digitaria exilis]